MADLDPDKLANLRLAATVAPKVRVGGDTLLALLDDRERLTAERDALFDRCKVSAYADEHGVLPMIRTYKAERDAIAAERDALRSEVERMRGLLRAVVEAGGPSIFGYGGMCGESVCAFCDIENFNGTDHADGCPWPALVAEVSR